MPPSLSPETLQSDRGENLGEGEKEAAPVTQPLLAGAAYLNNAPAVTALRINGSG
jgi:hypothetical protein